MARNHPVVMTDDISILTNYILGLEKVTPGQNTGPSPDSMPHIQGKNCVLDDSEEVDLPDESEFTRNVSRGNLKSPPLNLYDYSQYCYAYFKSRKEKCCSKIYLKAFQMDL